MSLPTSYLTGNYTKIPQYFEAIINAQAPEKFTQKFLKDLGFTSSTDTQFVNVLKTLGFLDESGTPTDRYFQFFDRNISKSLVADGIKEAYADIFKLNVKANEMDKTAIKAKFKQITEGKKSDSTLNQMVSTFVALCDYAEWNVQSKNVEIEMQENSKEEQALPKMISVDKTNKKSVNLCYDIHIHLPATRDEKVYDALFSSLTKHIEIK